MGTPLTSVHVGRGAEVGSQRESRSRMGDGDCAVAGAEAGSKVHPIYTLASMRRWTYSGVSHLVLVMLPWRVEATSA